MLNHNNLNQTQNNNLETPECEIIRGSEVTRSFLPDTNDFYQLYPSSEGYTPITGGDNYGFAIKHDEKRLVISYTEGDVIELAATSAEVYLAEVKGQLRFYEEEF